MNPDEFDKLIGAILLCVVPACVAIVAMWLGRPQRGCKTEFNCPPPCPKCGRCHYPPCPTHVAGEPAPPPVPGVRAVSLPAVRRRERADYLSGAAGGVFFKDCGDQVGDIADMMETKGKP